MHSAHNTAKLPDWLNSQNQVSSLVKTMLISQSLCDFSQPDFHHVCLSHIYTCHTSHILWKNLQVYNIECTVQQENTNSKEQAEL